MQAQRDAAAKVLATKIAHHMALAKIFFVWRVWTQRVEAMQPERDATEVLTTKSAHRVASAKIFFLWRVWTQHVERATRRSGQGAGDQDCAPHGFGQDLLCVARVDAARGGYAG